MLDLALGSKIKLKGAAERVYQQMQDRYIDNLAGCYVFFFGFATGLCGAQRTLSRRLIL